MNSNIAFLLILLCVSFIQQTIQQNNDTCTNILQLKASLEQKQAALKAVNDTDVQAQIDRYARARAFMNDALNIMSQQQTFLNLKTNNKNQIKVKSNAVAEIKDEINKLNIGCQQFNSFMDKDYQQTCESLVTVKQQIAQNVDFCSVAKTAGSLLATRKINSAYDKQQVCQAIYIIELMDALIVFQRSILSGGRLDQIKEALQKVIASSQSAGCGGLCSNGKFVTKYYKKYDYVSYPNYFVNGDTVGDVLQDDNYDLDKCKKYCDTLSSCGSFDDIPDQSYCCMNYSTYAQAKAKKLLIYQPTSSYKYKTTIYERQKTFTMVLDC